MVKREKGLLALFVLTLGLLMTACDSWMSGDHFFDTVAEEVKYANAEKIKVYVRYPTTTWGTTSPNGNSQQKVDIPFSVTAVDNSEYGFYKWAAFSTTGTDGYSTANGRHNIQLIESEAKFEEQYGAKVLGEDEVVFEDPYSPTTIVRVLNNRNDVFIMPICVRRPFLSSTMPSNNQVGAAKNTTIQLVFSNPMDPAFLLFDSADNPYESNTTDVIDAYLNTSNIFVEQVLSSGENPYNADITGKLRYDNGTLYTGNVKLPASLNKSRKTLTIKLPPTLALYWPNGTIMVSVSQTVQDNLGFSMSSDGQVTFNVGNDMDTIPPNVIKLEAGTTTLIDNSQSNVYPRVGKTINIRAVITDTTKTSDPPSEGNVNTLDYWMYLDDSLIESGNQTYSQAVNFTEVGNPKAELNASQRGMGVVFPVKFANTDGGSDGQYKLLVCGVDNVGNVGNLSDQIQDTDDTEAGAKFIFFIKDTRAPSVENINSKISAVNETWAPYGWYGREGLGHIEVKQASPGAIIDEPSSNPDPQYRSDKVWWAFRVGDWSSTETWRTDMKKDESIWDGTKWNEVTSDPQPLGAVDPDSVSEGIVSIYALLKDDVGNVSEAAQLNSVQYDGTAPAIGTMEWITENGIPKGFTGGNVLSTHTLAIPFTESLSGIKKIAIEVQPPSGAAGIMPWKKAFESGSIYAKRKNYNGNYYGVSFTKSMNAAGVQELILTNAATSSTSETYQNTLYLDNLTISNGTLVDGDYTLKVKLYDQALNVAEEKSIVISVDSVAPAVQKLLVEEAAQFAEEASDPTDDDTYRYFLTKDAYDTSRHAVKTTLDINVKEQTSGIYTLTLGNDAYITSSSTVTVVDSSGSPITAAYTKDLSTNTVTFTEKLKVRDANALGVTIKITNVELRGSEYGQKVISVSVKDYATLTHNNYNRLSFENDSDTYANISLDGYTSCTPYAPSDFVVTGSSSDAEGYAKETGVKASLTIPSGSSYASGLKKITFTGLKAKSVANYGPYATSVKLSGSTSNLGYTIDDDGNAIVLNYPIVNTSSITLEFTNLELTSLTQGSNTLSAKYEYLAGWQSPTKTTTVIYDTVVPVIGSSTELMTWVVKTDYTEIPGVSSSAAINGQYLVIPVTETNSGVRKIKIEVKKGDTEGNMVATTAASCASVAYVGYGTAGTSRAGATTLSSSYWSKSGNELTILDPVNYGKAAYYYIRGIKISDSATMEEGNYTLHVTLYDYAGNVSGEKTIDMCNDHTQPVVQDSWFDGVKNTANKRTYTTNSENNTLFVKVTESGSGIQKILLDHPFGYDPYVNGWSHCRVISTSDSTKLYYSVDGGATFTEVACTRSGSRPNYYLTVANENAIKAPAGSDIILKITGLSILDADYVTECAASVGVRLTDLAQNLSAYDDTHNNDETNKNLAAIAEDCDPADVHQTTTYPITMWDSEKVLQGTSLVAESGTRSAYSGYTNNPLVNIRCVMNEWVNLPRTPQSGLRAIVLEGATFTEQTEIEWKELYKPNSQDYWDWPGINSCYLDEPTHLHRHGSVLTGTYKGSKDSIAEVPFAMNTKDFYLVGNNTLVLETPVSVGNDGYVELRYVKLDNTTSDGTKTVKIKVYDVAGTYPKSDGTLDDSINKNAVRNHAHSDWPEEHEASKSITYCGTAPTIKVASTGGDPEAITAANMQTLMPTTNGLQAYAEGTTAWTYSYSSQNNRRGTNSTPSGNGVYLGSSYCPYFDLDITPSTAANLSYYKWTNSDTVPESGWNSTSSNKVNVNFPTSGDVSSVTAMDWYLHVADYAGNVTTKKMSQCQWINETVASAWPKRNSTGESGKEMVDGAYYLESTGFYTTDIPKLTVTLPAGTSGDVKVYIPTNWFNKVCDNGAPIYGYAIGNHTRYDEGHTDISKAKRDATGPYLEIPQSYITEATAQSTNIAGFYFYVYDAVGLDLTAVVEVTVDNTPPWLEPTIVPETTGYIKWKDNAAYVYRTTSSTEGTDRFFAAHHYTDGTSTGKINVAWNGSRVGPSNGSESNLTKGLTADNPLEFYTNSDIRVDLRAKDNDILSYKYSVDGVTHTIANTLGTWDGDFYRQSIPSIAITDTPQIIRIYAVDKGSNTTDLYFKITKDTEGPTITATGVSKVNQFTETVSGSNVKTNYFGANATASVTVSDALSGLKTVNGSSHTSYENVSTALSSLSYDSTAHTLKLNATDNFDNPASSSLEYNGGSRWVKDTSAPGTPSLVYTYPGSSSNTVWSDYNKNGQNGLAVSHSGSNWTVKFSGEVKKVTIKPSATDSGAAGIMGYIVLDSTSSLKNFYNQSEVFTTQNVFTVQGQTESTTKYVYAVDKAGNPSSTPLIIELKPNNVKPVCQSISGSGIYSSGTNGWFSSSARVTVSVTQSPELYWIGWGDDENPNNWTTGEYSTTIGIPDSVNGGTMLVLAFCKEGVWSDYYYIKAQNGTVSKTASNSVTTWALDSTAPSGIAVNTITASGTGGKAYKSSDTEIYYNGYTTGLTITPKATEAATDSGINGYALSSTGTPAATVTVPESGSTIPSSVTIYAFDKVGNSSSQTITLSKDTTAPTVGIVEGSTTGCTEIGGTLYYKDNTAKLQLSVTDSGSGVDESTGHLKNNEEILLSGYTGDGKLTIQSGKIADKVGNTQAYVLISNIVQDTAAPSAPTALTNAYSSDGKAYLSGSNKVFYNAGANSIQLTLSGAEDPSGGSGLAGYVINSTNYPYDTGYPTKVTISRNEGSFPGSITIKSYDGVGNVSSTGLTVTLVEDAAEPTVTATYSNSDSGTVYKSGDTVYFKGTPTVTLSISDGSGSGLASGYLQNGDTITLNSSYYDATNKCLKINSGMIKDNLGNTKEYTLNVGKLIKDESGPSVGSSNFTTGTGITIGTESTSSTNPVTWYKSGYYLYIEGCETGGSGLAYWQVGTSTTKQTSGTFVSSPAEDEDGKITLPTSITTPTVLYIYAEDHLGNSNYCKLSTIDGDYKDKWCYNDATAPAAPAITAVSSVEATVGGSSSSDYAYLDGANSKLYYNGSATALTVTMSSTLPDGVVGYSLSDTAGSATSTTLTASSIPSDAIRIYAFDYKGNVSTRLELTLAKDETAPTFTMPSTLTGVDKVRVNNDSWMVNTFQAGNTQITFTISDDEGSGLAGYAFVKKEEDYNYTGSISYTAATGASVTITLPDTNHYNTNFMLLLKDNVGNVTKADNSGSYESSAAVKTGSGDSKTGFWSSIPLSPSFSASYHIADDKKSVDITLSGVDFPVSSIKVTAAGISALKDNKCNMKERRNGETNEYSPSGTSYNNGTGTISLGDKYLSYDKTISFTFTGENIEAPTEIKINDTYTAGTLAAFSLISGFSRFSRGPIRIIDGDEELVEGPELVQQPVRNPTFADYFGKGLQPLQDFAEEDAPVAFNVGKNMLAVEESVGEMPVEKAVTMDLEDGYIAEDLDAENTVVQNLAWKAPDGPVLGNDEVEGQELALNMASESSTSGQTLSARDAAGVQEEKEGWNPALILALVSMLALGIVALFVRKRR